MDGRVVVRAAAPSDANVVSCRPNAAIDTRPAPSHAAMATRSARPGRSPRSIRNPRRSATDCRKIGSAEANRIAKMTANGTPMTRPRTTGRAAAGRPFVDSTRNGRARSTARGAPNPTASAARAPSSPIAVADRRVTGVPEMAMTAPTMHATAAIVSRATRNGSPRSATSDESTTALPGSHASSGSKGRPGRRTSQAAARTARTRIGTFTPYAAPYSRRSARTPMTRPAASTCRARRRSGWDGRSITNLRAGRSVGLLDAGGRVSDGAGSADVSAVVSAAEPGPMGWRQGHAR